MPYDATKGYIPYTQDQILTQYLSILNSTFGTSYTTTEFEGTGFWKLYQACAVKDLQFENAVADMLSEVEKIVQTLSTTIVTSMSGLVGGIKNALESLDAINAVSIYNPQDIDDMRGKIGIAIDYVDSNNSTDANISQIIANAIVNNIGAGIHTLVASSDNISATGVITANNQDMVVNWKSAVETPLYLKLSYKKNFATTLPTDADIKATLLKLLSSYQFGNTFTPTLYSSICEFSYFRYVLLEWSEDKTTYSSEEFTPDYWVLYQFSADNITLESLDT